MSEGHDSTISSFRCYVVMKRLLLLLLGVKAHGGKRRLLRTEDALPSSLGRDEHTFVTLDESGGVDCSWSDWSSWSFCSKSCGPGRRERKRWVAVREQGGKPCEGPAEEIEVCNVPCSAECRWENWQDWSSCTASCGGGSRERSRALASNRSACSMSDGHEEEACAEEPCVSCWGEWSSCTGCGGIRVRHSKEGCPRKSEEELCEACDCQLGEWSAWGPCNGPCKNSTAIAVRTRENQGACNAAEREERSCDCTEAKAEAEANQVQGPVDCTWAKWEMWQACSSSCGAGAQQRSRLVAQVANDLGQDCTGEARQSRPCKGEACPSCQTSDWSAWSACTGPCVYKSSRSIRVREPVRAGPCDAPLEEERACDCRSQGAKAAAKANETSSDGELQSSQEEEVPEKPIDCEWNSWEDWKACTQSCGGGVAHRLRERRKGNSLGTQCLGEARQTQNCQEAACPCSVGDWSDWSSCAGDCKGVSDRAVRTRELLQGTQSHCHHTLEQEKACSCGASEDLDDGTMTAADLRAQNLKGSVTPEAPEGQGAQSEAKGKRRVSGALELHVADPVSLSSDPDAETAAAAALSELMGEGQPSVSLMPKDNVTVDCWYSLVLPQEKANEVAAKLHAVELSDASNQIGTELQRLGYVVTVEKVSATVTATLT